MPLDYQQPPPAPPPAVPDPPECASAASQLAAAIKAWRLRRGLSQRQLAALCGVPRTYISKTEIERCVPTLKSIERYARVLEITVPDLLSGGESNRQNQIRSLLADEFLAQLAPSLSALTDLERRMVLIEIRNLSARRATARTATAAG